MFFELKIGNLIRLVPMMEVFTPMFVLWCLIIAFCDWYSWLWSFYLGVVLVLSICRVLTFPFLVVRFDMIWWSVQLSQPLTAGEILVHWFGVIVVLSVWDENDNLIPRSALKSICWCFKMTTVISTVHHNIHSNFLLSHRSYRGVAGRNTGIQVVSGLPPNVPFIVNKFKWKQFVLSTICAVFELIV